MTIKLECFREGQEEDCEREPARDAQAHRLGVGW